MKIAHHDLDDRIMIIAEIGNNHEGSLELAQQLVHEAANAGADAVKFQTIVPDRLVSARNRTRIEQLSRFQLTREDFKTLASQARDLGLLFLSTPFDLESVDFLDDLVPAFKIASGDNNFVPLIERIAEKGKPILLSTGMASLEEIRIARQIIEMTWQENQCASELAVLHCVVSYPTPAEDANLGMIEDLKTLGCTVGYSDHTIGNEAAVLSVGLGARIIEKHFTIDNNYSDYRDHQLSADPETFHALVESVRKAEQLIGDRQKHVIEAEQSCLTAVRRSIAAARALDAGHCLNQADIIWVRPGEGLPPGEEARVLGRKLSRALQPGEMILPEDLEDTCRDAS